MSLLLSVFVGATTAAQGATPRVSEFWLEDKQLSFVLIVQYLDSKLMYSFVDITTQFS